jgi:hypothetical protein
MVDVSLLVTLPLKVEPSFSVTVADGPPATGGAVLLHPARASNATKINAGDLFNLVLLLSQGYYQSPSSKA